MVSVFSPFGIAAQIVCARLTPGQRIDDGVVAEVFSIAQIIQERSEAAMFGAGVLPRPANDNDMVPAPQAPAVDPAESVTPSHIICLEDGKRLRMLKRYLRAQYDMSPEEYKKKWGLPDDYPMVHPAVSAQRRAFAKMSGLGNHPRL